MTINSRTANRMGQVKAENSDVMELPIALSVADRLMSDTTSLLEFHKRLYSEFSSRLGIKLS